MTTIQHTISILAIFLAAVSCTSREDARPDTSLRDEGRLISLSREAFVKSALDGDVARWTAGDEVAVYQNEGEAPKKFIAQEDGVTAHFSLKDGETPLGKTGKYFLVYPYSAVGTSAVSSNAVSLNIPAEQTAVKGSFDPSAAVAVAMGADYDGTFVFRNAHTLFKITVPENFGDDIFSIRLTANTEGEKFAGDCSVKFTSEGITVSPAETAVSSVVLSGKDGAALESGDYYIVAIPATVAGGICAEYIGTDGRVYFRYSTQGGEFIRNMIYNLGVTVSNAATSISLDSRYYTEGVSYVYGGRENRFPATLSGVSKAAFTSLPQGWNARLEDDALVVIPAENSEAGEYDIQMLAYAEGAKADIYTFKFRYDPKLILFDDFLGSDIDDRYWKRFGDYTTSLWCWFQTGDEAQSPVADSKLSLKAVYENGTYKTGAITGKDIFDYEPPFRVDCMAAMTRREEGFWCAIWTVPTTGYQDGEIDIMEAGDHYTSTDFTSKVHCTCHTLYTLNTPSKTYDLWRPGQDQPQSGNKVLDNPTGWHTYSVEVKADAVVWYVDGVQVHRYENKRHSTSDKGYRYAAESTVNAAGETVFPKANYLYNYPFMDHRYFAIMDIAVGGSFVGGENDKTKVPAQTGFNAQMDVDWIKITKIE